MQSMGDWLTNAVDRLDYAGIETARLDAELILSKALKKDRSWIIAHVDKTFENDIAQLVNSYLNRRLDHTPLAYIFGLKDFYGREFKVNKSVLVPRPESESIIDLFKELELPTHALVADVGSGSGALGITAKLERPDIDMYFMDIDSTALNVTKKNAKKFGLTCNHFYESNLLKACSKKYDVLLCNLPYVPVTYPVNEATKQEPKIALYSGKDGLDHYRRLFIQLSTGLYGKPQIITESLTEQHNSLAEIAESQGWRPIKTSGLAQLFMAM